MTDDVFYPDPFDLELAKRAEDLLDRLFCGTLTDSEAVELRGIWDRFPEMEKKAQLEFSAEQLLRFSAVGKRAWTANRLEGCKTRALEMLRAGGAGTEANIGNEREVPPAKSFVREFPDMDELVRLAAQSPSLPRSGPETKPKAATKPSPIVFARKESKPRRSLAVLVPLLLFIFGYMVYLEFKPVPEEVVDADDPFGPFPARVAELVDATFAETIRPLKRNERLEPGPISLQSGLVEIEYRNGIRVVLEGPANYHVETPLEAACDRGKLSAHVPPAGKGFTVTTPMMTVRDLGTKFVLDVDDVKTKLQVIEGEVEANWLTKDWLPFKEGRGVLRQLGNEVRNFIADPKTFVSESTVRQRKADSFAAHRDVWNERTRRRLADPTLVYRLEPETVARLPKTTGSREDKTAIRFRHSKERLPLALHRECRDLTMIASVRLRNLANNTNVILTGNELGDATGQFLWQMNHLGEIHFHIDEGNKVVRPFYVPPVFSLKDCNTWQQVAVVADAMKKTITHYRDGAAVGTCPWPRPVPLRLERMTVGNDVTGMSRSTRRSFNGDIEDLWIFSRPFDAGEIEEFYRNDN